MDQSERNRKRITELESSMMHLQNDYESLNEVVLENVQRLEKMRLIIERLESRLRVLIRKPRAAPLLAPCWRNPTPAGMTPHEQSGRGTPSRTARKTPEYP